MSFITTTVPEGVCPCLSHENTQEGRASVVYYGAGQGNLSERFDLKAKSNAHQ
jgi:hypothetical protein